MSNTSTTLMVVAGSLATIASQVTAFVKGAKRAEARAVAFLTEASQNFNEIMDALDELAKEVKTVSRTVTPAPKINTLGEVISTPAKSTAKTPKKVTKPSKPAKKVVAKAPKTPTKSKTAK